MACGLLAFLAAASIEADVTTSYLLFDVIPHEQLNKQRRAYMFYLDLAMRLKRTLVLPRARLVKKDDRGRFLLDQSEYVRWSEIFNVSRLSELHPVLELEEFLAQGNMVSLMTQIDHKGCANAEEIAIDFNGMRVPVGKFQCASGLQYNPAYLFKLKEYVSIGFSNSVDQMSPQQALPLRRYVRYTDSVYEAAAAFVRAQFGDKPFVALHWRRTDFLQLRRTQAGVLQSAEELVNHARSLMAKAGTDQVYLATDCDDADELAYVEAHLNPVRYPQLKRGASLREGVEIANLEVVICAMAARFLGTKTSSFTLAIAEERLAVFGQTAESGGEMDASRPAGSASQPGASGSTSPNQVRGHSNRQPEPQRGRKPAPTSLQSSPPNVSPVVRVMEQRRYLLFDAHLEGQLNQQRRTHAFYLDLALRLKRILVLPRVRLPRKGADGRLIPFEEEYVRWSEMFNISLLQRAHAVVELDDFLAQGQEISLMTQIDPQPCPGGGRGTVDFNGRRGVRVGKFQCSSSLQHDASSLASLNSLPAIGFALGTDQLSPQQALPLRRYVRYTDSVYEAAAAFVRAQFGDKPFVALHWRRTDFLQLRRTQAGVLQSAEELVNHARSLMAKAGTDQVYLATDCDDADELAYVEAHLNPVRYPQLKRGASLREGVEIANLEVVICAMAARFLGTKTSSFTLAIAEERLAVFGKTAESGGEMDLLRSAPKTFGQQPTPYSPMGGKDEL